MSRYILVPTADGKELSITIPQGIGENVIYDSLKFKVRDTAKLRKLLVDLTLNDIAEDEEGRILLNQNAYSNFKLRDVLETICNDVFLGKYESIYKLFRSCGIVF